MAMPLPHILLAVAVMAIWGFNFVASKVAVAILPPIFLIALRFMIAGLFLAPFVKRPRGRQWLRVTAASFTLGCLHFCLMFTGLKGLDASTVAIASQIQVPFAALLAAIFFKERLGLRRAVGMAIAFGGIVLVAGQPRLGGDLGSLGLVIAASFVWALANVQIKSFREPVDGLTLTAWIAIFAAPQLLAVSWLLETGQIAALEGASALIWAAVLYTALMVAMLSYAMWYFLLGRYPINHMMAFTLLVPVFGVMSGVIFLDDPLTSSLIVGGIATIVGVGIISLRRTRAIAAAEGGGRS